MKNLLFFVLYLLVNPGLVKLFLNGIYIPVYVQFEWLKDYKVDTVVDVGAYHGHVSKVVRYIFPNAKLYMFDPVKENIEAIAKSNYLKNAIMEQLALSDKSGKVQFYKSKFLPASSLLNFKEDSPAVYTKGSKRIRVTTTTLDDYFSDIDLTNDTFLKIDVQGAEGLVLKGAKKFLNKVSIIHIETSFNGLYKNESTFEDIYDILVKSGFRYLGSIPDSQFYPYFGIEKYTNAVFIKKS